MEIDDRNKILHQVRQIDMLANIIQEHGSIYIALPIISCLLLHLTISISMFHTSGTELTSVSIAERLRSLLSRKPSYSWYSCAFSLLIRIPKQIPRHVRIRQGANRLLHQRLLVEMTERCGFQPGHHLYRTRPGLEFSTNEFDRRLTALQRTIARFCGARVYNSLTIEIDKARFLRAISATPTGIRKCSVKLESGVTKRGRSRRTLHSSATCTLQSNSANIVADSMDPQAFSLRQWKVSSFSRRSIIFLTERVGEDQIHNMRSEDFPTSGCILKHATKIH